MLKVKLRPEMYSMYTEIPVMSLVILELVCWLLQYFHYSCERLAIVQRCLFVCLHPVL